MIRTEREKIREVRKLDILSTFKGSETQYTNQIAKGIGVTWMVADRLLQQMVDEGRLYGNKMLGYSTQKKPEDMSRWEKLKRMLNVGSH
jgi:predicted transcriptional regulator